MRYYATLGPACCEASALAALLRRGVSGFRLNVSHTMLAARRDWIDALHDAERSTGLSAQLMIDLRGPEVRIGALPSPLTLTAGEAVTLGADIPVEKDVLAALVPGMTVLLDDGAMALTVLDGGRCRVTRGGVLTGHKSLTPEGTELHRPALCEADLADLAQAAALGVSAVMQPFVRSADDLRTVRQAMRRTALPTRSCSPRWRIRRGWTPFRTGWTFATWSPSPGAIWAAAFLWSSCPPPRSTSPPCAAAAASRFWW